MGKNGVYMIEDVHNTQPEVLSHIMSKYGWDNTFAISLYDSIICVEKCDYAWKENIARP